jgi:hypothetical protein
MMERMKEIVVDCDKLTERYSISLVFDYDSVCIHMYDRKDEDYTRLEIYMNQDFIIYDVIENDDYPMNDEEWQDGRDRIEMDRLENNIKDWIKYSEESRIMKEKQRNKIMS